MSKYLGHTKSYAVLDAVLKAFEAGGYERFIPYSVSESVLVDSNPAPGYVPGVKGKKETGIEYVPNADGSPINLYYVSGGETQPRQIERAKRALRSGVDPNNLEGRLISIRRCKNGNIQVQFTVQNRDERDKDGKIMEDISIDSVSISPDPAENGGVIVALAFDQSIGIPFHQLKALKDSEVAKYYGGETEAKPVDMFSKSVSARRAEVIDGDEKPAEIPEVKKGNVPAKEVSEEA